MNPGYDEESRALVEKTYKESQALHEKYKGADLYSHGLDGGPWKKAFDELTKRFSTELKALKKKYGIEDHYGER